MMNKNFYIKTDCQKVLLVLPLILFFIFGFATAVSANPVCIIGGAAACAGKTQLLKTSSNDNAHAGTLGGSSYTNFLCCSESTAGVTVGTAVTGALFLKLFAVDNSHVAESVYVGPPAYSNNVYISADTGGYTCGYTSVGGICGAGTSCVAKISVDGTLSNGHIADCGLGNASYSRVCCGYSAACVPSCPGGCANVGQGDGCGGFCPNNTGNACNDGNACTGGDVCGGGVCGGTSIIACSAGDGCCPAGCANPPDTDCAACVPSCVAGSCNDGCGGSFCNGNACNDGNACTNNDKCSGGVCSGSAITCNDGNVCTNDSCNPASGCVFTNNTSFCDDGKACTSGDVCSGGVCSGTVNCASYCAGLTYFYNGGCDAAGNCAYGSSDDCGDTNVCTDNNCYDASGCSITNNANLCDDSKACTYDDVCGGGVCGGTLEICGNNFCRVGCETATSCPADCKCGDGIINGIEICDKNGDVGCGGATPACKTNCSGCIGCTLKSNLVFMGKPVICIVTETIKWILSIAGRLVLLILILSGIYYVASGDNPEKQEKAKKIISYAIIGLVVVLVSYGLLALIDRIFAQS